jgi:hypothetical protein
MTEIGDESAYECMGRTWLGLGNLDAPVWFIGMEPGGDRSKDEAWALDWANRFGHAPTVDLHESAGKPEEKYLGQDGHLQPTWQGLIRFRLAYAGLSTTDADVLRYQREELGRSGGAEALLEGSGYAAKSLKEKSPREKYLATRIDRLHELILEHVPKPEVVLCYGRTYASYFESVCGGPFDSDGFRWSGDTLCTLTPHPYQRRGASPSPEFWTELGREMRRRVDERRA